MFLIKYNPKVIMDIIMTLISVCLNETANIKKLIDVARGTNPNNEYCSFARQRQNANAINEVIAKMYSTILNIDSRLLLFVSIIITPHYFFVITCSSSRLSLAISEYLLLQF